MNRFSRQVGPRRLASKHSKTVGTTLGLTTVPHYSSESNQVGRILLCADGRMGTRLYEAAQVMLTRMSKWSWLKAWPMNARHRRGEGIV